MDSAPGQSRRRCGPLSRRRHTIAERDSGDQNLGRREQIEATTVGLPPGAGGSIRGQRVAYSVLDTRTNESRLGLADVSATPNPRRLTTGNARVLGFRPDDETLLYAIGQNVYETRLDGTVSDQLVGPGNTAWYDSTGNIVLLRQSLPSGGTPPTYPALALGCEEVSGRPGLWAHPCSRPASSMSARSIGPSPSLAKAR